MPHKVLRNDQSVRATQRGTGTDTIVDKGVPTTNAAVSRPGGALMRASSRAATSSLMKLPPLALRLIRLPAKAVAEFALYSWSTNSIHRPCDVAKLRSNMPDFQLEFRSWNML
eukprot:4921264-Pyramimonas_sp.AAC.1